MYAKRVLKAQQAMEKTLDPTLELQERNLNQRPHPQLNAHQVGIQAALEWLMSFFGIFEIIKTADLLQDAMVMGLDSLVQSMPTEQDVKGVFDTVRGVISNLT